MKIEVDRDEYYRLLEKVSSLERETAISTSYRPEVERLKQERSRIKQKLDEKYDDYKEHEKLKGEE